MGVRWRRTAWPGPGGPRRDGARSDLTDRLLRQPRVAVRRKRAVSPRRLALADEPRLDAAPRSLDDLRADRGQLYALRGARAPRPAGGCDSRRGVGRGRPRRRVQPGVEE